MMRKHWPKFLFALAVLLAGGAYAVKTYPVLILNNVRVIGTERFAADQLGVITGENLLDVNTGRIIDSVLAIPYVATAETRFNLDGDLLVRVTEKEPLCYVYTNRLLGVTSRCELLPLDTSEIISLPIIRGVKLAKPDLYKPIADPGLHAAVRLMTLLESGTEETWHQVSEVVVTDDGLQLILEPGSVLASLGWGDYQKKIYMLEVILAGNKNPALELDLRFADMVILKTSSSDREVKHGV